MWSTSLSTDTSGIHLQTQKCMQTPAESGQEYLTSGKEYMLLLLLLSRFSCVQLCDPRDCSLPDSSSVHGIFQGRTLAWIAIFYSSS